MILMIYVPALNKYLPVIYILMTGKTFECYFQAFHYLCSEIPGFDPFCVGVDFERAFFKAVRLHFPEAHLQGCRFHYKQALRKKLAEMGVKADQIRYAMQKGQLDLLMVIPMEEIEDGVRYVREQLMEHVFKMTSFEKEDTQLWDDFFDNYFEK